MTTVWNPEMLRVTTQELTLAGRPVTVLQRGSPLWHLVTALGEQTVQALDELNFLRTDGLGRTHGFRVKELAVTPDGHTALVHLDVTRARLFNPAAATTAARGKPTPYLSLIHQKVVEQIRVRCSEMVGARLDVGVDNHYWVRYVIDLRALNGEAAAFSSSGDLADHIAAAPGPFHIPLGLDLQGNLHWYDVCAGGKHALLTGTTGAGKSTWLDGAITTLVRHAPPEDLKLIFLDPQRLNFSPYSTLRDYRFADARGPLKAAWQAVEMVDTVVRLNEEHLRRVERIGATPWSSIESYNAHVEPAVRMPYLFLFTDELAVLRSVIAEQAGRRELKAFDSALNSLIVGGRKVGFRLFLCLQYLKADYIPMEVAGQAGLILAFQNTPQGSKNTLGDTSAALLPGQGRFIAQGLPEGRRTYQGLYVSREQVLDMLRPEVRRPTHPVDGLVLEMLSFALEVLDGELARAELVGAFGHLMSVRQIGRFTAALEAAGLALPPDRSAVPPRPRRLSERSLDALRERLQYHPEIAFREAEGETGVTLIFGAEG